MARFIDAPTADRCTQTITLRDGSTAQCGRRGQHPGGQAHPDRRLCAQHLRMAEELSDDVRAWAEAEYERAEIERQSQPVSRWDADYDGEG